VSKCPQRISFLSTPERDVTHTKVIVPHPVVRSLFTQQEMWEGRGNLMDVIQEFDLEIKVTRTFRDCAKWMQNMKI
jgi:hypothetical protein